MEEISLLLIFNQIGKITCPFYPYNTTLLFINLLKLFRGYIVSNYALILHYKNMTLQEGNISIRVDKKLMKRCLLIFLMALISFLALPVTEFKAFCQVTNVKYTYLSYNLKHFLFSTVGKQCSPFKEIRMVGNQYIYKL